jgi:outer membrane assembly lipoprotein YfiO
MHRSSWGLAALLMLVAAACRPDFQLRRYTTNDALYEAALREYQRGRWSNAVSGFERLTGQLGPRDTLITRAYWYLGQSHGRQREFLLAAQAYNRIAELFPEDTLADNAALEAARAYWKLWRRPALDPTYGETALQNYLTLLTFYPDSPLVPEAERELLELKDWFAIKTYEAGLDYFRDRAYDSAIPYFQRVLTDWADTPTAVQAGARLVESYRAIRYLDDVAETCAWLRERYQDQAAIRRACPLSAAPPTAPPPPPERSPR